MGGVHTNRGVRSDVAWRLMFANPCAGMSLFCFSLLVLLRSYTSLSSWIKAECGQGLECLSLCQASLSNVVPSTAQAPIFLRMDVQMPGESHGQRSLQVPVHRVAKSRTWLKRLNTHTYTDEWMKRMEGKKRQTKCFLKFFHNTLLKLQKLEE